jgi:hypothetical protein
MKNYTRSVTQKTTMLRLAESKIFNGLHRHTSRHQAEDKRAFIGTDPQFGRCANPQIAITPNFYLPTANFVYTVEDDG